MDKEFQPGFETVRNRMENVEKRLVFKIKIQEWRIDIAVEKPKQRLSVYSYEERTKKSQRMN